MAEEFDAYNSGQDDLDNPASAAEAIVPHDTNALGRTSRGIYVGAAGNITCRLINDNNDTLFVGVPAGTILPVRVSHVRATGTVAASLVALF